MKNKNNQGNQRKENKTKLTNQELKALKANCNINHFKVYRNKRGKVSLFWNCPSTFDLNTFTLVLNCLICFEIKPLIWDHSPNMIIKIMDYLECDDFGCMYITALMNRQTKINTMGKILKLMIKMFGFDSKNKMLTCLLEMMDNSLGYPQDLVEMYLNNNFTFQKEPFLDKLKQLHKQWKNFWKYRYLTNCIFCKLDLKFQKPVTRRMEVIREMPCCLSLCCSSCNYIFFQEVRYHELLVKTKDGSPYTFGYAANQKQCPSCQHQFEYDIANKIYKTDNECSVLAHRMNCNNIRRSINRELTENEIRYGYCPQWLEKFQTNTENHGHMLLNGQVRYMTPDVTSQRNFPISEHQLSGNLRLYERYTIHNGEIIRCLADFPLEGYKAVNPNL